MYPAYQCYKTVERGDAAGNVELKKWCTYWYAMARSTTERWRVHESDVLTSTTPSRIILAVFTSSEGLLDRCLGWYATQQRLRFPTRAWRPCSDRRQP